MGLKQMQHQTETRKQQILAIYEKVALSDYMSLDSVVDIEYDGRPGKERNAEPDERIFVVLEGEAIEPRQPLLRRRFMISRQLLEENAFRVEPMTRPKRELPLKGDVTFPIKTPETCMPDAAKAMELILRFMKDDRDNPSNVPGEDPPTRLFNLRERSLDLKTVFWIAHFYYELGQPECISKKEVQDWALELFDQLKLADLDIDAGERELESFAMLGAIAAFMGLYRLELHVLALVARAERPGTTGGRSPFQVHGREGQVELVVAKTAELLKDYCPAKHNCIDEFWSLGPESDWPHLLRNFLQERVPHYLPAHVRL